MNTYAHQISTLSPYRRTPEPAKKKKQTYRLHKSQAIKLLILTMPLQLHTTTLYLPHTLFSFSPQLFLFLSSLDDLAHAPCWSKASKAIHLTNDTSFQTGGNCCAINNRSSLSPCNCVPRLAHTVTGLQDCHDLQCMKQTSRCGTLALSISCGKDLITVPVTAAQLYLLLFSYQKHQMCSRRTQEASSSNPDP